MDPRTTSIVAAAPAYFYDLDFLGARPRAAGGPVALPRRLLPRLLVARVFEIGSSAPVVSPLLHAAALPTAAAGEALPRAGLEEARRGGASMLIVQSFESLTGPAADALRALGFAPVPMPATAIVALPYGPFDEHLAAMRAIVRVAIEDGFPSVNLGMTTLEPKLDAGAVAMPLYAWIGHRNALLQRVYAWLAWGPFAPRRVGPRTVFKG